MEGRIGNDRLTEEEAEYLRMYMYSLVDPDVLPWKIPSIREHLKKFEDLEDIKKHDRWLIEDIKEIIKVNPAIEDDDSQPLEKWWWHLHKIAEGSYPKELLPDYLQKVYEANS